MNTLKVGSTHKKDRCHGKLHDTKKNREKNVILFLRCSFMLKCVFRTLLHLSMAAHKRGIQIMRINKIRSISLPDLMRASSFAITGIYQNKYE